MQIVTLDALMGTVRERAADAPLDRVEAAIEVGAELNLRGDELIGRFVEEARGAGLSWTDIGARMGVSKQAARQRFAQPPAPAPAAAPAAAPAFAPAPAAATPAAAAGAVHDSPGKQRRRRRGKAAGAACSFCGKLRTASLRLIAGPGVYICAECVGLCTEILAEQGAGPGEPTE